VTAGELRRIRKQLGFTQAALAERVGVTANSIARQERGEMGITEPVARLIRQLETDTQEHRRETTKMAPTAKDFEAALNASFASAWRQGLDHLDVEAGSLHRQVGGYPGSAHRMPLCCAVMRKAMRPGDRMLQEPPKGDGATVRVRYFSRRGTAE
jgi:transcriptional regulator with XRE-family HTH domain